jgi:hypothetical protein
VTKTLLVANSSPVSAEADAEFVRWYDEVHIPDVRSVIPSITSVGRYRVYDADTAALPRYVTIYEIDGIDAESAAAALQSARVSGALVVADSMNITDHPPAVQFLSKA